MNPWNGLTLKLPRYVWSRVHRTGKKVVQSLLAVRAPRLDGDLPSSLATWERASSVLPVHANYTRTRQQAVSLSSSREMAEKEKGKSQFPPTTSKEIKKRKTELEKATTKKVYESARAQTRVNIGKAFHRWRELKALQQLTTDAMVAVFLLDR